MPRNRDPDRRRPGPTHPGYDPREIDVDMDICRWCSALVPADEAHRIKHEDWDQRVANRFAQLLERVALLEAARARQYPSPGYQPSGFHPDMPPPQLSGSGSNADVTTSDSPDPGPTSEVGASAPEKAAETSPASGPTSEAGVRPERTSLAPRGRVGASASDANVPTPEQEVTASRSGVEGAKDTQADAAGLPPGGVTAPLASSPREARGTNLVSREEMLKEWEPLAESVPEELGGTQRSRSDGPGDAPTGRLPLPELGNPARFAR